MSQAPTRNQWMRPPERGANRWPRAAASMDLPLPPAPTRARRGGGLPDGARERGELAAAAFHAAGRGGNIER